MIVTDCTLLSLSKLIRPFKLHVLNTRKLTLLSWGSIDYTFGMSANVQIQHVFSMMFTHLLENSIQQCFFHCNRANGPMCAKL